MRELKTLLHDNKKHEEQLIVATQKFVSLEAKLRDNKCVVKDLKSEKKGLTRKVTMLKDNLSKVKVGDVTKCVKEIDDLSVQVKNLNAENTELQHLVDLLNKEELVTFENGRFSDDIGVSIQKVATEATTSKD